MDEVLHALSPMMVPMPAKSIHDDMTSASQGKFDIAAFLERYRQAMDRQSSELGKQSVLQTYGENALAMLEAMQARAATGPVVLPAVQFQQDVMATPLTGKYGAVLTPFLGMMEHELHANSDKGDRPGWLSMDRKTGLLEIFYHLAKLQKATKDNDIFRIREYSADVANMSMMLADVCGALDEHAPSGACESPAAVMVALSGEEA